MRTARLSLIALVATLCAGTVYAQDLTGDWQGTVTIAAAAATRSFRQILHVEKGTGGSAWKGTFASIDQGSDRGLTMPIETLTIQGADVFFKLPDGRSYQGKMSADRNAVAGTFSFGRTAPLDFTRATPATAWTHASPHTVQFVTVDQDVKLEVLDWGGPSGRQARTLVMLSGNGNTAHVFDQFVQTLTAQYHVYGITRRGFGASSVPASGYAADRLGDDVLTVLDALKITRPVLVGHSIAGEELSSIGSRRPDRVAGLIYLDAGYSYAFYDSALPTSLDASSATGPARAIIEGQQRYTKIPVPILAIYAFPHDLGQQAAATPEGRAAQAAAEEIAVGAQSAAFERGLPSARVVRIPRANHYVFQSNEADVLREMNAFIAGLK